MTTQSSSKVEDLVVLLTAGSAMLLFLLSVLIWRFDVRLFGMKEEAGSIFGVVYLAVAGLNLLLFLGYHICERVWLAVVLCFTFTVTGLVAVAPGVMAASHGPQGAGTAAAGVGFLIAVAVSAIGGSGIFSAAVFGRRLYVATKEKKADRVAGGN
jgi:hypothetical protein